MSEFKNIIVAAANQYMVTYPSGEAKIITLVDNCHMGRNMQETLQLLRDLGCELELLKTEDRGQGFIDESGHFYNRSEAYKIAFFSGQPFNNQYTLPNYKLDSSCIRHFQQEESWLDYIRED